MARVKRSVNAKKKRQDLDDLFSWHLRAENPVR